MKGVVMKQAKGKHAIKVKLGLCLVKALAKLPMSVIQRLGQIIGFLCWYIPNPFKTVTKINIEACFPDKTPAFKRDLAIKSLQNTFMTVFEYAMHWFWPVSQINATIVDPDPATEALFYAAQAKGKGVIILSPHMGAWESMLGYLPEKMTATMMYRPLRIPELEHTVRSARERAGAKLVPASASGIRAMFKALKKNEVVVMLPDQVPIVSGGVIAPFFGVPALTMTLAAKFAQKTGAVVLVGYVERLGIGGGFKPHALQVPDLIYDEDPVVATTAMNETLQAAVEQHLDQYVWSYKRFKRRGATYPKLY
jgi:KDO2-lipid IV(A) lauroyltransferase